MTCARLIVAAVLVLSAGFIAQAGGLADFARENKIPVYEVEITGEIPHDTKSFTQGLLYHDGALYESTGLYGQSTLNKLDGLTGELLQKTALDSGYFGEGLTFCNGKLVQITWHENTALVWDPADLALVKTFSYSGEGWGLASNGHSLIMSNGSAWLYRRNASDFSLEDSVAVTHAGRRVMGLNELEFAHGRIYANFLGLDDLAEIDPANGRITAVVDGGALRDRITTTPLETPLNGIAHDPASGEFFLTGKLWPKIFKVTFIASFGR